ncbi:hypothetical protein [Planomonospora parontospora]|uniref:hypothetical protein n=1 Tax=Planomonospora parontospora TaxID=58119 RepID=UPI001670337D|nr:hypothetical protein [Planomonospora parontospora]
MRVWLTAAVIAVVMSLLVSGVGVPDGLVRRAAAAAPDESAPEPSVEGRAVPDAEADKGAEEKDPVVKLKPPVWPKVGSAEVRADAGLERAADLPVRIAAADKAAAVGTVKVETLAPEAVRKLGGVGVAARIERADGSAAPGRVRAEFSYAGFRDAFGGNFASRLRLLRLPVCALTTPRPPPAPRRSRPRPSSWRPGRCSYWPAG